MYNLIGEYIQCFSTSKKSECMLRDDAHDEEQTILNIDECLLDLMNKGYLGISHSILEDLVVFLLPNLFIMLSYDQSIKQSHVSHA